MNPDRSTAGAARPAGEVEPVERPVATPGRLGLVLIAVGAALGVLALTVLNWFRGDLGLLRGSHSTAGDISDLLDTLVTRRRALDDRDAFHLGLSDYYYSWLAWLLLAAVVIVAVVAVLPTAEGGRIRILATMLALLGIGATISALDVYRPAHDAAVASGPSYLDFVDHASFGAWAAFAAFALIGLGAGLGPRRRQIPSPLS